MKFTKHLFLGFRSYKDAFQFIFKNKLWKYFLISIVLFGLIFYTGHSFRELEQNAAEIIKAKTYGWGFVGWTWYKLKSLFFWFMGFLFLDATKYMVMILLSPLLAILSEKTEEILTGKIYKFNLKQLLKDVKRGVGIAIRMLIAEFALILIVWKPICSILGFNEILTYQDGEHTKYLIYEAGAVLIGFYFYGFAFIDYINERLRLSIKESWKFMNKHAGLAFGIGSLYSLFYKVPSLFNTGTKWIDTILDNFGVLFAPVLAIVAATIAMHKLVDLNKSKYSEIKKEKKSIFT